MYFGSILPNGWCAEPLESGRAEPGIALAAVWDDSRPEPKAGAEWSDPPVLE